MEALENHFLDSIPKFRFSNSKHEIPGFEKDFGSQATASHGILMAHSSQNSHKTQYDYLLKLLFQKIGAWGVSAQDTLNIIACPCAPEARAQRVRNITQI